MLEHFPGSVTTAHLLAAILQLNGHEPAMHFEFIEAHVPFVSGVYAGRRLNCDGLKLQLALDLRD